MLVTGGGTGSPQAPCGLPARPWAEASAPNAISLTVYRHPARVNSTPQEFSLRGHCAAYRASAAHAAGKVVMLLADGELAACSPSPVTILLSRDRRPQLYGRWPAPAHPLVTDRVTRL